MSHRHSFLEWFYQGQGKGVSSGFGANQATWQVTGVSNWTVLLWYKQQGALQEGNMFPLQHWPGRGLQEDRGRLPNNLHCMWRKHKEWIYWRNREKTFLWEALTMSRMWRRKEPINLHGSILWRSMSEWWWEICSHTFPWGWFNSSLSPRGGRQMKLE